MLDTTIVEQFRVALSAILPPSHDLTSSFTEAERIVVELQRLLKKAQAQTAGFHPGVEVSMMRVHITLYEQKVDTNNAAQIARDTAAGHLGSGDDIRVGYVFDPSHERELARASARDAGS